MIVDILGPDPKFARQYPQNNPHFRVRVRWLNRIQSSVRSTYGLHDLDLRIADFGRQMHEMDELARRARRG